MRPLAQRGEGDRRIGFPQENEPRRGRTFHNGERRQTSHTGAPDGAGDVE